MAGEVTSTIDFTAFGERFAATGVGTQPFGFAGEMFDSTTALSYNRARWMDPQTGRFLAMDPHPGSQTAPLTLNPFLYGGANPVNHVDPTGWNYTLSGLMTVASVSAAINIVRVRPADFRGTVRAAVAGATVGLAVYTGMAAVELAVARFIATATVTTTAAAATALTKAEQIYENNFSGKAYELALAERFRDAGYEVVQGVAYNTPFGTRVYDLVIYKGGQLLGAIEAKVGNAAYGPAQRLKDEYLLLTQGIWTNVIRVAKWPP